jgi:hemolysin activation/secretion protein
VPQAVGEGTINGDPLVVKKYPDGTKVLVRLSAVQKENGTPGQDSANPSANGSETVYYAPGQTTNKPVSTARLKVAEKSAPQKSSPSPQAPSKPTSVATPSPTVSPPEESSPTARFQVGGTPVSPGFDRTMYSGMGPSLKYGQSFQDYAPKSVPSGPLSPGVKTQTEAPPAPPSSNQEVTEKLQGVVLSAKPEEVVPQGRPGVRGVISNVPGMDAPTAETLVTSYLGKAATLNDLNAVCRAISTYFIERNEPVVTAILPEQEIRDGVVQILVLRGKVGRVIARGTRYFDPENLEEAVDLREGEDINLQTLTDDVNWLNSNPFRQVDPTLTPGKKPGMTDIVLETKDRFPVRPFIGYDNFGIQSLGYDRYSAGLSLIDVWTGLDQQINWQYLTSGGFTSLISNNGSYSLALPWKHTLTFFGGYSSANPTSNSPISQSGYFWQVSGRYNIPLPTLSLLEGLDYRHQTYVGYDFKASDTALFFNGSDLGPGAGVGLYNISQFVLGYSLNFTDPLGSTSFEAVMFGSPGGMSGYNNDTSFQNVDQGADAAYVYGKLSLQRMFRLPLDGSLVLSGQIQQTDSNLMPSESFGIGGYDTVRGYDQRAANGDIGYLGNIEIRSPVISLIGDGPNGQPMDQLVFLGFLDYGQVLQYQVNAQQSQLYPNWHLMSIGPGLRYNIGSYLSVRFDWGFQLQQAPPGTTGGGQGGRPGTSQAVLSATLAY